MRLAFTKNTRTIFGTPVSADGKVVGRVYPFYFRTIYDGITLAAQTTFQFFAGQTTAANRNYVHGQNFFKSNQGRLLALGARLLGASYGALRFQSITAASGIDILNAWNALVSQCTFRIELDSRPVHYGLLQDIMPLAPIVSSAQEVGTATNTYKPADVLVAPGDFGVSSAVNQKTQKNAVYFETPIEVPNGRTLNFFAEMPSGVTIDTDLNNFILQFVAVLEEIPNADPQSVRA